MDMLSGVFFALLPWLVFVVVVALFFLLVHQAKKRRGLAIALAILVQMFVPDPKAQVTIEAIAERKQEVKKQQGGIGKPLDDNTD
jgi:hypothetical protein